MTYPFQRAIAMVTCFWKPARARARVRIGVRARARVRG